jgi:transposase
MPSKKETIHLEIQTSRKSPVGIIRSSYYEDGVVKHKQYGRVKGKSLNELKLLQLSFRGKVCPKNDKESFKILESKEYGASKAILEIINQLDLDKIIYSKQEPWVKDVLAMIAGRIIYAGSKLSLCNVSNNSMLWSLCGIENSPDVTRNCYNSLDQLIKRQKSIQKKLSQKHVQDGHLVLYDITSSYLEGEYENSELVKFGYNRDGKKGHEQIVIGLLCSKEGCPVSIEVFPGNTNDESTVMNKVREIKNDYSIKKIIFVGDRGMVTQSTAEKLETEESIETIGALTHGEMLTLLDKGTIQPELFDAMNVCEVSDQDDPSKRYCLNKNPLSSQRDKQTRERLLDLTIEGLTDVSNYKRSTTVAILGARIGKVLQKYKMGKYISWDIEADSDSKSNKSTKHKITWNKLEDKIVKAELLDGCYIITTKIAKEEMPAQEVVQSYMRLQLVERAFRNLKTTQLEVRPIYHKTDDRIKAHVFLCMLSYYVQWHMTKLLSPLFENDKKGSQRRWTFAGVVESLRQISCNKVSMNDISFYQNTKPNLEQKEILDLLKVSI